MPPTSITPPGTPGASLSAARDPAQGLDRPGSVGKFLSFGRRSKNDNASTLAALKARLHVPETPLSAELSERLKHHGLGQHLARQDRFADLACRMRLADKRRDKTRAGKPVAMLMAEGARADVVLAAEHALFEGELAPDANIEDGIAALEEMLEEHPDTYPLAAVTAMAHIDIARAWRDQRPLQAMPEVNRDKYFAHFDRAEKLLEPHCVLANRSPTLAEIRCTMREAEPDAAGRVADDFEDLIELDPGNPLSLRTLGRALLPSRYGSYERLAASASHYGTYLGDIWGNGAFVWVCFDAMLEDPEVLNHLDLDAYAAGVVDILDRMPDQHTVNMIAAQLRTAMAGRLDAAGAVDGEDPVFAQLHWVFETLVPVRLREVHPAVWAHAMMAFDPSLRDTAFARLAASGREPALTALAGLFRDALDMGRRVVFRDTGVDIVDA